MASATFFQSGAGSEAAREAASISGGAASMPAPRCHRGSPESRRGCPRGCLAGSAGLPRRQRGAAPMAAPRCQDGSAGLPGWQRGAAIGAWQRRAAIGAAPPEIEAASRAASLPAGQPRAAARRCRDACLALAHASQGGRFRGGGGREGSRLLAGSAARSGRGRSSWLAPTAGTARRHEKQRPDDMHGPLRPVNRLAHELEKARG